MKVTSCPQLRCGGFRRLFVGITLDGTPPVTSPCAHGVGDARDTNGAGDAHAGVLAAAASPRGRAPRRAIGFSQLRWRGLRVDAHRRSGHLPRAA